MKNVIRIFAVSSLFALIGLNANAQEKKTGLVKASKASTSKTKVNVPVKAQKVSSTSETSKTVSEPKVISKETFDKLPPKQQKFVLDNPTKYQVK